MTITDSIKLTGGEVVKLRGDNRPNLSLARISWVRREWKSTDEEKMEADVFLSVEIDGKKQYKAHELEAYDGPPMDKRMTAINVGDKFVASSDCRSTDLAFGKVIGFTPKKIVVELDDGARTNKYPAKICILK